ncbi:MAG: hypothetical protein JSW50_12480 [Candidatus Latescibacterota bacterium]|nr:MAG: hypothetical protein JSW50_12480 [Candidatus Latescibacterota bacterium]
MKRVSRVSKIIPLIALFGGLVLTGPGCGDEETDGDGPNGIVQPRLDTIPPAVVVDLRIRAPNIHTLAVVWTAPGDDGPDGVAARYDIRYSTSSITPENWDQARAIDERLIPTPKPGGQVETIVVVGLEPGTTYHFALKTADEVPNWSGVSNCTNGTTLGEIIPPAEILDLAATGVAAGSYELTWTAPGDDGNVGQASHYDIRYSTYPIDDDEDWQVATPAVDVPAPSPAGHTERVTLTGLGNQDGFFFALRTADEHYNWSGRSNTAVAIKFGSTFWVFPGNVQIGEEIYIIFETATTDVLTLTTNGLYVPRVCNEGVIEVLARESFPDGIHIMTFDFVNRSTGEYYREDYYWIALCNGNVALDMASVQFRH